MSFSLCNPYKVHHKPLHNIYYVVYAVNLCTGDRVWYKPMVSRLGHNSEITPNLYWHRLNPSLLLLMVEGQ